MNVGPDEYAAGYGQMNVVPGETTQDDGQTGQMKPASLSGVIHAVLARTAAEMLCKHPCEGKCI